MAAKGPERDIRDARLKKLSEIQKEVDIEFLWEGWGQEIPFFMHHAQDTVDDWWSKYGTSMVQKRHRSSPKSDLQISIATTKGLE